MILSLEIENYESFKDKIRINFESDVIIKILNCDVNRNSNFNISKISLIEGINNLGKNTILSSLTTLKSLMLNGDTKISLCFLKDETKVMIRYY